MFDLLAQVNPEGIAALMIPMIVFMIPIVAILTSHQRKMADLIHGKQQQGHALLSIDPNRVAALESEVARLRDAVSRQTIELDNLRMSAPSVQGPDELSSRINQ